MTGVPGGVPPLNLSAPAVSRAGGGYATGQAHSATGDIYYDRDKFGLEKILPWAVIGVIGVVGYRIWKRRMK